MPIKHEVVYGIFVYNITTKLKVPYQLTFERDLFFDRTNATLIPLIELEQLNCNNPDLRKQVIESFESFFESNPNETVYFEVDTYHEKNLIKLHKFIRWFTPFNKHYSIKFDFTITNEIHYTEVILKKIQPL